MLGKFDKIASESLAIIFGIVEVRVGEEVLFLRCDIYFLGWKRW